MGTQKGATNHVFASLLLSQAVLGAKVAPKPPPRASGTPRSLDFVCFWVDFLYIFAIISRSSWITFGLVFRSVCSSSEHAAPLQNEQHMFYFVDFSLDATKKETAMEASRQASRRAVKQASRQAGSRHANQQASGQAVKQASRQAVKQASK